MMSHATSWTSTSRSAYRYPMQKLCSKCSLPFECSANTPDCWCQGVAAWEGVRQMVRQKYPDCLCKTCFSMTFYHPNTLKSAWGIVPECKLKSPTHYPHLP